MAESQPAETNIGETFVGNAAKNERIIRIISRASRRAEATRRAMWQSAASNAPSFTSGFPGARGRLRAVREAGRNLQTIYSIHVGRGRVATAE